MDLNDFWKWLNRETTYVIGFIDENGDFQQTSLTAVMQHYRAFRGLGFGLIMEDEVGTKAKIQVDDK